MDTPITRAEHEEFRRRIEEEEHRQNRRLDIVEGNISKRNRIHIFTNWNVGGT